MSRLPAVMFSFCLISPVAAEVVEFNLGEAIVLESATAPQRGQTRNSVLNQFGEPLSRDRAEGRPPISRWYYGGFVVVFEYDHVVHSIRLPKQP